MERSTSATTARERLRSKLKQKKNARSKSSLNTEEPKEESGDLFQMISQVQSMLKTNPGMVNKVSSCINSLMSNPNMMQQLSSEIETTLNHPSQTLITSLSGVDTAAVSKES